VATLRATGLNIQQGTVRVT